MPESKWQREHAACRKAMAATKEHYDQRRNKRLEVKCSDCKQPFTTPIRQLTAAAVNGQVRAPERCAGCR